MTVVALPLPPRLHDKNHAETATHPDKNSAAGYLRITSGQGSGLSFCLFDDSTDPGVVQSEMLADLLHVDWPRTVQGESLSIIKMRQCWKAVLEVQHSPTREDQGAHEVGARLR